MTLITVFFAILFQMWISTRVTDAWYIHLYTSFHCNKMYRHVLPFTALLPGRPQSKRVIHQLPCKHMHYHGPCKLISLSTLPVQYGIPKEKFPTCSVGYIWVWWTDCSGNILTGSRRGRRRWKQLWKHKHESKESMWMHGHTCAMLYICQ